MTDVNEQEADAGCIDQGEKRVVENVGDKVGNGFDFSFFNKMKVSQMDENENKNSCAGIRHGFGAESSSAGGRLNGVLSTAGLAVFQKQDDTGDNMEKKDGVKPDFKNGDKYPQGVQVVRIGVKRASPPENCTVAYGMNEQKPAKHKPSKRHDVLFAQ